MIIFRTLALPRPAGHRPKHLPLRALFFRIHLRFFFFFTHVQLTCPMPNVKEFVNRTSGREDTGPQTFGHLAPNLNLAKI